MEWASATGTNVEHALPWMRYVVYESQEETEGALEEISEHPQQNRPLHISSQASRVWLLPADRVHYVVCEGVISPKAR